MKPFLGTKTICTKMRIHVVYKFCNHRFQLQQFRTNTCDFSYRNGAIPRRTDFTAFEHTWLTQVGAEKFFLAVLDVIRVRANFGVLVSTIMSPSQRSPFARQNADSGTPKHGFLLCR